MARIDIKITGPSLGGIVLTDTRLMRKIGEGLLTRIRKRTAKGKDYRGRAFKQLSALYAARKLEALGNAKADLTVSGRMMNDINVRPNRDHVSLSFAGGGSTKASGSTFIQRSRSISGADKAFWHNETGAGKNRTKREFFDVSDQDEDWATEMVADHIAKAI